MEQIINYLAFMVVIVIVTIFLFELPGSNLTVEKSGKTHILQAEPGQGYWDYLLVAGMGILLLLEIFLINI